MNSGNDFTKHIHVKNIIRLLSILLMVFFFVPYRSQFFEFDLIFLQSLPQYI